MIRVLTIFGDIQGRELIFSIGFGDVATQDFTRLRFDHGVAIAAFSLIRHFIRHWFRHLSALEAAQRRRLCAEGLWSRLS